MITVKYNVKLLKAYNRHSWFTQASMKADLNTILDRLEFHTSQLKQASNRNKAEICLKCCQD